MLHAGMQKQKKTKKTKKNIRADRIHAHSHSFAHFVEAGEVANAFEYIV
jgi:hypothetical protein